MPNDATSSVLPIATTTAGDPPEQTAPLTVVPRWGDLAAVDADVLAIGVLADGRLTGALAADTLQHLADADIGLRDLLRVRRFAGRAGLQAATVLLVGLGERDQFDDEALHRAAAVVVKEAAGATRVATAIALAAAGTISEAAVLAAYRYDRYKTTTTATAAGAAAATARCHRNGRRRRCWLLPGEHEDGRRQQEAAGQCSGRAAVVTGRDQTTWILGRVAQERLGVSPATFYWYVRRGDIRSTTLHAHGQRSYMVYHEADVERLAASARDQRLAIRAACGRKGGQATKMRYGRTFSQAIGTPERSAERSTPPADRSPSQSGSALVPDAVWARIQPLLPAVWLGPGHPPRDDRDVLNGIVYVLTAGIHWRHLPTQLGYGCGRTCVRRVQRWAAAGVWEEIQQILAPHFGDRIDWEAARWLPQPARRMTPPPVSRRGDGQ